MKNICTELKHTLTYVTCQLLRCLYYNQHNRPIKNPLYRDMLQVSSEQSIQTAAMSLVLGCFTYSGKHLSVSIYESKQPPIWMELAVDAKGFVLYFNDYRTGRCMHTNPRSREATR